MGLRITSSRPSAVVSDPADVSTPASNTAAVVTYAASVTGQSHALSGVTWSYTNDPASGNLKIEDGAGNVILSMDITSKGPAWLYFDPPKRGTPNTALIVTLAAGGPAIFGKISVISRWLE